MLEFIESFRDIAVICLDTYKFIKPLPDVDPAMPRFMYCTLEDLQDRFLISRYQLVGYLRQLNIEPFGELQNYGESGKRQRGVGKQCFDIAIINDIEQLLFNTIETEEVKKEAMEIIGSLRSRE